jgi:diguanylate cyclase (GGDEF)-like protein
MRSTPANLPAERRALILRAIGAAWPVQVLVVALWLLVPHASDAREGWVIALVLGIAPLYLPLLGPCPPAMSRTSMNVAGAVGIAHVGALVWAGGGLMSGFELFTMWFLPLSVCVSPRRDVALQVALIVSLCGAAAVIEAEAGDTEPQRVMFGFAVVAIATLAANTALVGFLYGRLRATTEAFQDRSMRDPLTGLANRALLRERLDGLGAAPERAVYVIDVDGFKFVNDSLGHHAGDQLLKLVAARLAGHVRQGDLLARPGGDEFVLLADGIGDDEAALSLGRRLAASCDEPFSLDDEEVEVSVTIGVCRVAHAGGGEEAMRDADLALYAAKTERRGSVQLFAAPMREAATSRLTLERHLRRALERDELHVVYQPVVSVEDGSVTGMEALLRWRSEALGDVSPGEFIPIAERTGLILPIGRFVLARAIEQLAEWRAAGYAIRMSVNLSASQLADEQLPELLTNLLAAHGLPGEPLLLELTETALMCDATAQPLQMLDRLRATGAGLVLDDFGTGYSSLARLSRLKLAAVKIDRAFIAAMEDDRGAQAVVTAVLQMAGPLGCAVVAEGVETERQAELLAELGCPRAQGWLYGRPEPAPVATARLAAASRRTAGAFTAA